MKRNYLGGINNIGRDNGANPMNIAVIVVLSLCMGALCFAFYFLTQNDVKKTALSIAAIFLLLGIAVLANVGKKRRKGGMNWKM